MTCHIAGVTLRYKRKPIEYCSVFVGSLLILCFWSFCLVEKNTEEDADGFSDCGYTSYRKNYAKDEHNGSSIFFIETSGEMCLTARQLCSIESAARTNPILDVAIYMEAKQIADNGKLGKSAGQRRNCFITQNILFASYKNIRVHREDLLELLRDTPLWRLVDKNLLSKSSHQLIHRSDALRAAVLWKRGGLYLDLDCVVLRAVDCLKNTVGSVDFIPNWVENGVMAFDAGHPLLGFLMKYMVFAFKANEYMSLGPATLTDAIKYFCDREDLPSSRLLTCKNSSVFIQPHYAFYAINNQRQNAFYHEHADSRDWNSLKKSYLTHVYDAGNVNRSVPSGSLYAKLAQKYCPLTYESALKEGHF